MQLVIENKWALAYQKVVMACQLYDYTCHAAKKPENRPLNRYRDVNPYDHSRVILVRSKNDYINANIVTVERVNRRYILSQGPLAFTGGHFWLMIWEQNTKSILMLNKLYEKNEAKCHRYWPKHVGNVENFDDVGLKITLVEEKNCDYYFTRVIRVYDCESQTSRDVVQYHYTTWPDFGVPRCPNSFLRFLKRVRDFGVLDSTDGPPVIHCSAGIGRSGTFCLVDCCLAILEKEGVDNLNIQETLKELRRYRMGLIQTPDQLRFCYQAVLEGAKRLGPNVSEDTVMADSVYSFVGGDEAPPPPPPRSASLNAPPLRYPAPLRALPNIPTSESLGDLKLSTPQESSSSDESQHSATASISSASSANDDGEEPSIDTIPESYDDNLPSSPVVLSRSSASSADDEAEELTVNTVAESTAEATETVRKRRNRELSERVFAMKKRAKETERWHALKRSFYKPITITVGFILAGIIIYAYVKH